MSQQPNHTFGRSKRLSGRGEFTRLFTSGQTIRANGMMLKALPNGLEKTRFGCAVRRKVAPQAVIRNRFKRWLREAFRIHQTQMPRGMDLVAVMLECPEDSSFRSIEATFLRLCKQLNA